MRMQVNETAACMLQRPHDVKTQKPWVDLECPMAEGGWWCSWLRLNLLMDTGDQGGEFRDFLEMNENVEQWVRARGKPVLGVWWDIGGATCAIACVCVGVDAQSDKERKRERERERARGI